MKRQALKAKQDCLFWSSTKRRKTFSKINDSVKYTLKRWTTYHPHVIKYPIVSYYIIVKFDDRNGGVSTEIGKKVFIQASVGELHIYIQKKALVFPCYMM